MKNFLRLRPSLAALLLTGLLAACSCSKDKSDDNAPAATGDGTVTWTHSGATYTSTAFSSAIVDGTDKILITGSSSDQKNTVTLTLQGIDTKGAAAYDLRKGSVLDKLPSGIMNLNGSTYNTLYGPAASNGTIIVSQYDKATQKISGTFSYTAGALPNTSASGTQSVTSGTFSFTKFR